MKDKSYLRKRIRSEVENNCKEIASFKQSSKKNSIENVFEPKKQNIMSKTKRKSKKASIAKKKQSKNEKSSNKFLKTLESLSNAKIKIIDTMEYLSSKDNEINDIQSENCKMEVEINLEQIFQKNRKTDLHICELEFYGGI